MTTADMIAALRAGAVTPNMLDAIADRLTQIAIAIADEISIAQKEHKSKFPHDDYKAANIALGGLRNVGFVIAPETMQPCGNDIAVSILRAISQNSSS